MKNYENKIKSKSNGTKNSFKDQIKMKIYRYIIETMILLQKIKIVKRLNIFLISQTLNRRINAINAKFIEAKSKKRKF